MGDVRRDVGRGSLLSGSARTLRTASARTTGAQGRVAEPGSWGPLRPGRSLADPETTGCEAAVGEDPGDARPGNPKEGSRAKRARAALRDDRQAGDYDDDDAAAGRVTPRVARDTQRAGRCRPGSAASEGSGKIHEIEDDPYVNLAGQQANLKRASGSRPRPGDVVPRPGTRSGSHVEDGTTALGTSGTIPAPRGRQTILSQPIGVFDVHAASFLRCDRPQPVVLFEFAKSPRRARRRSSARRSASRFEQGQGAWSRYGRSITTARDEIPPRGRTDRLRGVDRNRSPLASR